MCVREWHETVAMKTANLFAFISAFYIDMVVIPGDNV